MQSKLGGDKLAHKTRDGCPGLATRMGGDRNFKTAGYELRHCFGTVQSGGGSFG
jgi:hypothetical protein